MQAASVGDECVLGGGGPGSLGHRLVHDEVFSQRGKCNTQVLPSIPHLFFMN